MRYADIIIDISHEKLDKTFQYRIPERLENTIDVGAQVWIPFGNGDRKVKGYVVECSDELKIAPERIKEIAGVVKDAVAIETQLIALAAWMKKNYGGTMNQALKTVIPIKKKEAVRQKKIVRLCIDFREAEIQLLKLRARKGHSAAKERLLVKLIEEKELFWETITGKLHIPSSVIRDLEKRGIVMIESRRDYRNPVQGMRKEDVRLVLSEEQQAVCDLFARDYDAKKRGVYLLHGVTGSGKTAVYMEMIAHVLAQGRQVIVLIPEIALTYQTLVRFYTRFGNLVSVLNSRMSLGERFDQFERAKNGEIKIMVGPRSALFTPFEHLGLIVIDEEHEAAYKSETVPKYHARETAIYRARMCQASVVLGSATPSVESYSKACKNEYRLLTLPHRIRKQALAECEVIDLREELKAGNRSILSRRLQEEMKKRLDSGEQTMLFLNRRGLMGFVSCRACGHVIKCPHCDVSLSLHNNGRMRCHYCGYETEKPKVCPSCGSKYIGGFHAGTQKIEEVVKKTFPAARVLRMDWDTTRGKYGHQQILSAFSNREADILVGTQMIVKGHDFPDVTLVGVLAADLSLNGGDYRSAERTFQLLTQAAGRAGRGEKEGRVLIQTYQPDHYSVAAAAHQNYREFYDREIWYRQMMEYPPKAHMLLIQITSPNEEEAGRLSEELAEKILVWQAGQKAVSDSKSAGNIRMNGPADAAVRKVNDVYRRVIYIKSERYDVLVEIKDMLEQYARECVTSAHAYIWYDFDPMNGF